MKKTVLRLLAIIVLAFSASAAQVITRCAPSEHCQAPKTFRYESAPSPMNAPVTFGGVVNNGPEPMWLWLKAGEPATPCTSKQLDDPAWTGMCTAKIGEPLYQTHEFKITNTP